MYAKTRLWVRRNFLPLVTGALVIASVVGAGALILSVAEREDPLHEADVGLAELGTLGNALLLHPENVVDRGGAAPSDLAVNGGIGQQARAAAERAEREWPNAATARIQSETSRTATLSRRTIRLAYDGDLGAARVVIGRLAPRVESLNAQLRDARARLADEIDAVQSDATTGMFAITGALGVALVLVMLGFSASRRRRVREEAEKEAVRQSEQRLQALVRHGSDMVTVVAPDTTAWLGP